MSGIGDAADKAKQYAQDNPEKVDQAKDKAKDIAGQGEGDQDQGDEKQPQ
ncbi:antitoxin [Citricoccus nitrophenolicus]|uniref:Antitoxin n=1 Tax=Citricoccus nitrophenolicus TaxID=863575 RepID=A0ABV0IHV1_9MICC|nr:antitoxin [Citricoccus sp. I39-566]WMY78022.1 antitoxin [Citricoccus sp. I39-566]